MYNCIQVNCDKELGWYKSVKKTQASVEVTSFSQMRTIFKYGCYSIGSAKAQICQSYHEVIQLTLQERDEPLTKKSYTLEELRDLESKLVLITGSKVENRAQVDTFIDVSYIFPFVIIINQRNFVRLCTACVG